MGRGRFAAEKGTLVDHCHGDGHRDAGHHPASGTARPGWSAPLVLDRAICCRFACKSASSLACASVGNQWHNSDTASLRPLGRKRFAWNVCFKRKRFRSLCCVNGSHNIPRQARAGPRAGLSPPRQWLGGIKAEASHCLLSPVVAMAVPAQHPPSLRSPGPAGPALGTG